MGIRFECVHCGHTLHVKDYLAGKRGICPHCQGKIDIPRTSTEIASGDEPSGIAVELKSAFEEQPTREMRPEDVASHAAETALAPTSAPTSTDDTLVNRQMATTSGGDPIAEAPQLQWYVLPPGSMTKYGPAQGEMMRAWLQEGRVPADALVWREGWPQWRAAAAVFPYLAQAVPGAMPARPTATVSNNSAPVSTVASNALPSGTVRTNTTAMASGPTATVPFEIGPAAQQLPAQRPVVVGDVTDDATVVPYAAGPGEAVVLGEDDAQPVNKRAAARHKPPRKMREQRSLIIALLVVLVVVFLPLLVWVLLHQ
jgi:hypothetical protein